MRIHLKITSNKEHVPFDHQHLLTGKIHKWIGRNNIHDAISLYSFSQLQNGTRVENGLDFPSGTSWFISFWDSQIIKTLISSIREDPVLIYGMKVQEIILRETPIFENNVKFRVASPVLIKRNVDSRTKFYYYNDKESDLFLSQTMHNKMKNAGLPRDDSLKISFDLNYRLKRTKKINYKKGNIIIENKCSLCPVIIQGKPETIAFAWNVGVGNSTGIGFGSLI